MIGMIRPGKGQKFFISAVDRIADTRPDVFFLVVGSATEPEYLEDIKKDIAALRHRNNDTLNRGERYARETRRLRTRRRAGILGHRSFL